MKKISVIVPVYNREKLITRCLDSLINQTFQNLEIIVVNDGSTDNTGIIVTQYQEKYPEKIKVIHSKNGGVSSARNIGIEAATGFYIAFLDSDDYVNPKMYEKLYLKMISDDYDMVACNTVAIYPGYEKVIDSAIQDNQSNKKLMIDAYLVLWNKLYRSELIKPLRFKENVWYEDVLFLYQLYPMVKKCGRIDDACIYYIQNENSITYTYNEKLYQLVENMDDIILYYKKNNEFQKYKQELEYSYVRYLYGTFIKRLAKSKDVKKYNDGVKYCISKVNKQFPNYRKNQYLNQKNAKAFYLKHFNFWVSKIVFWREKNRMN